MNIYITLSFSAIFLLKEFSRGKALLSAILPPGWEEVCELEEKVLDWNPQAPSFNWSQPVTQISCLLTTGALYLRDFRNWSNVTQTEGVALKIRCADQKNTFVSFPWPMKAPNLVSLEIADCRIHDWYSEYLSDSDHSIPQNLRIVSFENIIKDRSVSFLEDLVANVSKVSRDVHCISVLLEKYVFKNVSTKTIFKPEQLSGLMDTVYDWQRQEQMIPHKCHYKYLQVMDESKNRMTNVKHFFNQQYKGSFPELRSYNLSYMGYYLVPAELQEWRMEYPKLQYLDLRGNNFYDFYFRDYGKPEHGVGEIDLRHNNISKLTSQSLEALSALRTAVVNLRNNPLSCDCHTNEYLYKLLRDNARLDAIPGLAPYEYIRNMTCASPVRLQGVPFWMVQEDDILCVRVEPLSARFIVTVSALVVLMLMAVVLSVLVFKYRREMTILLYTRCGISIRHLTKEKKTFDAFIAYSSLDSNWVLNTLVQRLEENDKGQRFKLCVHHRDFEVGAAIADNVVKSVESSRYTILVLSRNFTKSEWCIYEFRTAMHQSLMEKRRHMVIIVLEDVPKADLEPDLRKCLETYTYITVGDRLFWDKLVYSLSRGRAKDPKTPHNPA